MKKILLFFLLFVQLAVLQAQETVVLVHGFLLTSHHMVPIERHLRCSFDTCFFEYPSRHDFIANHGARLAAYLNNIACEKPGVPINFVTHSIGALVLRSALNLPNCPQEAKIGRAVLLGPPNQGSVMARYFSDSIFAKIALGSKSGYELMTYTPQDINCCIGQFPECMQVLVVAGIKGIHPIFFGEPNDRFLTVEETKLNTPYRHLVLCLSHGELISASQVINETRRFLLCGNISE